MLMAGVGGMVAIALMAQVVTGGMEETVLLAVEAIHLFGVFLAEQVA